MTFILIFLVVEFLLIFLVIFLKKNFKWIINDSDEVPHFNKKALKKFFNNSFDYELGWVRKPLSNGIEKGKNKIIHFEIDKYGSRKSILDSSKASIVSIGDSYTFCRQVEDNETWQNHLAEVSGNAVLNYGVGNYGIDQAIIRLNKVHLPIDCKYAILGFVPETISRIQSYWKHYLEFGNTFAFKPKFELKNGKLKLIPQYIDTFEKYSSLKSNLKYIKSNDRFYNDKFLKLKFKFPYSFVFFRNLKHYSYIFYNLLRFGLYKKKHIYNKIFNKIVRQNLIDSQKLYLEKKSTDLLLSLINLFETTCKKKKIKPVILVMPQLHDLKSTSMNHSVFFSNLKSDSLVVDMSEVFKTKQIEKLYIDDFYGGHLSNYANKLVSEALFKKLDLK